MNNKKEEIHYPLYAKKVGESVANRECELRILCCGSARNIFNI